MQEQNINNINNLDLKLNINDQLFLEVLLMQIRGKTISFSSYKKKMRDNTEKKLIEEINELEKDEINNTDLLTEKKSELKELRSKKLEGVMTRSRAKWIEQGEKTSKYFCNLENRNYVSKSMPHLWKADGTKTTEQKEIVNETKTFYENLYSPRPVTDINLSEILNSTDIPKLNNTEKKMI